MPTKLHIQEDNPLRNPVLALLEEHLIHMREITPAGSIHALDPGALSAPDITFWTAWAGADLAGCGALLRLDEGAGEIKSMRTAPQYRRQGVASHLLQHLIAEARARSYDRLFLETGAGTEFRAAHDLYLSAEFRFCSAFGSYVPDGNSVYMTLELKR